MTSLKHKLKEIRSKFQLVTHVDKASKSNRLRKKKCFKTIAYI